MYYSSKLSLLKFLHSSCHIYLVCDYEKIFCRLIFKNISNCENISKAPLAKYINKVPLFTPPFDFSLWNNQLFTIIQDKQPLWLMFSFSIHCTQKPQSISNSFLLTLYETVMKQNILYKKKLFGMVAADDKLMKYISLFILSTLKLSNDDQFSPNFASMT